MKNKALKSFVLFSAVLTIGLFCFSHQAKALEIEQPDYSHVAPATTTDWNTSYNYLQKLGTGIFGELENVILFQKNDQTNYDVDQVCLYYSTSSTYSQLNNLGTCVKHGVNKRLTYESQPYDFSSQSLSFNPDYYYAYQFFGGIMEDQAHSWAEEQFKGQSATSTEDGYIYGEYTHNRSTAPKLKHPYFWFQGLARNTESIYFSDYTSIASLQDNPLACCQNEDCEIQMTGLDNNTTLSLYNVSNATTSSCLAISATGYPLTAVASTTYQETYQNSYLEYNFGNTIGTYQYCVNGVRPLSGNYAFRQYDLNVIVYASTTEYCILKQEEKPTFGFCEDPCAGMEDGLGNDIFCGFKQAGCWFVEPDPNAFKQLKKNYLSLQKEFPFNLYFSLAQSIEGGLSTSTIDNRAGGFGFVMFDGEQFYVEEAINSSTISNFFGEEKENDFRVVSAYIMWGVACIYIIFRIKRR